MNRKTNLLISVSLLLALSYFIVTAPRAHAEAGFTLTSTAFTSGSAIPTDNSCSGANTSPSLTWSGTPAGTKSFALIVQDPDAPHGTFTHWIAFDIPAAASSMPAAVPHTDELVGGGEQGMNSAAKIGYMGPCPPPGKVHHYHFELYALNSTINLPKGASLRAVQAAMQAHVIGKAELIGTFSK
ncbi:MAG TPA: YbhB/YbcL family Raf kinase inhibitor-like protein [Candidatus Binataceae bacterium]|nr:YbhB/YbcL family Raf kinase inhibitor-like protein [Candidatus Binataceae bacterium]